MIVSLSETKKALRVDHPDDDASLNLYIQAASEAVLAYLKVDDLDDVPSRVKLATILLVSHLYEPRENDPFEGDKLPAPVLAMLHSLRMPTIS